MQYVQPLSRSGGGGLGSVRGASRSGPRLSSQQPALSEEQAESLLWTLAREAGGTVEKLGRAIDTPGAIFRGVLAGKPTSGFNWSAEKRVSGRDLLEDYGLITRNTNPYLATTAGLAAEIALDPLALVTGPMRALTPAGKAAKAAGLLDKASDAYMAKKGIDALRNSSITGRATSKWAGRLAREGVPETLETFSVRPLVGPRVARTKTTLDDVVRFVDDAKQNTLAREAVDNYLAKKGIRYEDVADQRLGGAIGLGYFSPFTTIDDFPGSQTILDAMDRTGQALAWNPISRYASAMFDNRVNDSFKAADQVESLKHTKYLEDAASNGRRLAAKHTMNLSEIKLSPEAQQALGAETLLSQQGNDFLTRMFENTFTKSDLRLKNLIGPNIDKALKSWDEIIKYNVDEGKRLGIQISPYSDKYGVRYSPRSAKEADFGDYGQGLNKSVYNTRMLEQKTREEYLQTPGGTVDLRELSLLPKVDDFARKGQDSQYTLDQVSEEIRNYLNTKHGPTGMASRAVPLPGENYAITKEQTDKIASFLQRADKRRPDGLPLFSEHPVTSQARNIVSQHMARANASYVYDSLAESAVAAARGTLGGEFKSAKSALNDIARQIGLEMGDAGQAGAISQARLREAIGKRLGVAADTVDLDQMSVPESVYNRLTRIQQVYNSPNTQKELFKFFDNFSSLFKGFVLAWPSRFVRDMYSNVFSIWLENGSVQDTLYGLKVAKGIVRGNFEDVAPLLKQLPQYANLADDAAIKAKFMEDAAGSGLLQTLASNDLVSTNRVTGDMAQLVPGATPMNRMDFWQDLTKGDNWKNFFQIKGIKFPGQADAAYETLNPLLTAQQRLSDFNDTVARLGGYLSLMRQGVAPDVAAKRMTEALVDYGSLTPMERNYFRAIFPWWAYNSRIGKYVVKNLTSNPSGTYAQTIRAVNTIQAADEDTYIPEAFRQQLSFRIPEAMLPYLGYDPNDDQTIVGRDLDLPGMDVLGYFDPNRPITGTARNAANQMNPAIRSFLELSTGQDFFSRRPLEEAVTPLDRAYMSITDSKKPLPPSVRLGINMIPGLQRPISLIGGLADQRLTPLQRVIKQGIANTTGLKEANLDEDYIVADQDRALADALQGYTRTVRRDYVPDWMMPYLPESKKQLPALQRYVQKRQARIRDEKYKKIQADEAAKRSRQFLQGTGR